MLPDAKKIPELAILISAINTLNGCENTWYLILIYVVLNTTTITSIVPIRAKRGTSHPRCPTPVAIDRVPYPPPGRYYLAALANLG